MTRLFRVPEFFMVISDGIHWMMTRVMDSNRKGKREGRAGAEPPLVFFKIELSIT